MAAKSNVVKGLARVGRLRRFLPAGGQAFGAALTCVLWTGLASPGLQLLPGLDGLADDSIAISLQSAMLGIDDGSGRPAEDRAREAAAVLGLTHADWLTSPAAGRGPTSPSLVQLGAVFPDELAAVSTPAAATGPAAEPSAPAAPPSETPATEPAATPGAPAPAPREPTAAPELPAAAPVDEPSSLQSIAFTSAAPSAVVGGSYHVTAVATSGLPLKFSVAADTGVCKVSGAVVSFRESGTCVIVAYQSGNATYREAYAQQSIRVSRAAQSVSFLSAPPAAAVAGGPVYAVAAKASSGLPVSFSTISSSPGVCRVAGTVVVLQAAGTCTVAATQVGNERYEPAQAHQAFAVVKVARPQEIEFSSRPPSPAVVGAAYSLAAAAGSGLPVTFSATGSSGVCTVSGAQVSLVGEGTCVVAADQRGDESHLPAPTALQAFAVERAPQLLSFVTSPPASAVAGSTDYSVDAAATSGLPVVLSVPQSSASVCAVSGSTVTAIGAGTCTIEASQPGNTTYAAAFQIQQSFTVGAPAPSLSDQTITFTSSPPPAAAVGGAAYSVGASASSGLPVSFGAVASSAGVCTVSGSTVRFVGVGTCTVGADQAGGSGYHPAPQAQQSFAVGRASQALSFASTPPVPAAVGGPDYVVSANASSGLVVTFAAAAASAGVCTVSGANVTLLGSGTCTVVANQAGNADYDPAPAVQQAFTVGGGAPTLSPQTISYTSTAPSTAVVGGPSYTVVAAASSGLPVVFGASPASAGVCSISGSTVSFLGAGTCTILADQPGSASYQPAPQAQQSFSVTPPPPAAQTISFTSTAPGAAVYGGPGYTVAATASSGLPVAFSIAPGSAEVCRIAGSSVTFVGVGACAIRANQAGNSSYAAAPQVQQSFTVARAPQTITITSAPGEATKRHREPYTIAATSSSGLGVTFSVAPASEKNCSINGSEIKFKKQGDCVVSANQGGNANYLPAPQVQQTIAVD